MVWHGLPARENTAKMAVPHLILFNGPSIFLVEFSRIRGCKEIHKLLGGLGFLTEKQ